MTGCVLRHDLPAEAGSHAAGSQGEHLTCFRVPRKRYAEVIPAQWQETDCSR